MMANMAMIGDGYIIFGYVLSQEQKCWVWSVKYGVESVKCEVRSAKCEVECEVWSVKSEVRGESGLWG